MIKHFLEWLIFKDQPGTKIIEIRGLNLFLVNLYGWDRVLLKPIWDKERIGRLLKRLI
jgi:hypothetical protein